MQLLPIEVLSYIVGIWILDLIFAPVTLTRDKADELPIRT